MSNHLSRIHKASAKTCRSYKAYADSFETIGPDDISGLHDGCSPIKGLRLHEGRVCRSCGYITASDDKIKKHANKEHGWVKKQGQRWDIKPVQTFFTNNKTRYFIVAGPEAISPGGLDGCCSSAEHRPSDDVDSMIQSLLDRRERRERDVEKERGKADEDRLKLDNTPWLRKSGWHRRFAGKDLLAIADFGNKPTKDEGTLRVICESVDRVFARCKDNVADCQADGWDLLLSWLKSSKKDDYAPDPFSVYYEKSTHEKYVDYWKRFLCYCLRLLDEDDQLGAEFTHRQLQGLQELLCFILATTRPKLWGHGPHGGSCGGSEMRVWGQVVGSSCRPP